MNKPEKVLISAPIGGLKQYSINDWFNWIANQTYDNYEICICTNGKEQDILIEKLNQVEITDIHGQVKKIKVLSLKESDELSVIQKITYSREKIRRYAVENEFDYIFFLDTDTIPTIKDAIERLMSWNVDCVSGLYFYKESRVAVVIDEETGTNISLDKIEHLFENNLLYSVWGFGFGVLLLSRDAFKFPFDYDLFGEERSDDFGYCHVLEANKVVRYFDARVICQHLSDPEGKGYIQAGFKIPVVTTKRLNSQKNNDKDGEIKKRAEGSDKNMDRKKD